MGVEILTLNAVRWCPVPWLVVCQVSARSMVTSKQSKLHSAVDYLIELLKLREGLLPDQDGSPGPTSLVLVRCRREDHK